MISGLVQKAGWSVQGEVTNWAVATDYHDKERKRKPKENKCVLMKF